MTLLLLATSSIAAVTTSQDVTSVAFIAGAGLMVGALLYAIFTNGVLNVDDDDTPAAAGDRPETEQRGDTTR